MEDGWVDEAVKIHERIGSLNCDVESGFPWQNGSGGPLLAVEVLSKGAIGDELVNQERMALHLHTATH
jgi:hypothetical protein